MANILFPSTLLALDPDLVRVVNPVGVSVFAGDCVHVFAMPKDIGNLQAFCWAHNIPFEGRIEKPEPISTVEKTPDTIRAGEGPNPDPAKRLQISDYNWWLHQIGSSERRMWSARTAGMNTMQRVALWAKEA